MNYKSLLLKFSRNSKVSFSQEGEDLIVLEFLKRIKSHNGFYVDVGAHHPFRFSNTALLYQKGWRGINIEADPDLLRAFKRYRPDDKNINVGISSHENTFKFFRFRDKAWNTFSEERALFVEDKLDEKSEVLYLKTTSLNGILSNNLNIFKGISILNIDIEGLDEIVLTSLDLEKYKFSIILIEDHKRRWPDNSVISNLLYHHNYVELAKTNKTYIFVEDKLIRSE